MVNDPVLHEPLGDPCDHLLGEYIRRMADRGSSSLENPQDTSEWSADAMTSVPRTPRARRSGPPPSTPYIRTQTHNDDDAGVKRTTGKGETKNLVEHNPAIVEKILEELMGPEPGVV